MAGFFRHLDGPHVTLETLGLGLECTCSPNRVYGIPVCHGMPGFTGKQVRWKQYLEQLNQIDHEFASNLDL